MPQKYVNFLGRINRREPRDRGEEGDVYLRENFLAKDGRLQRPRGTNKAITTVLTGVPTWTARYHTVETGQVSPKTFSYTQDGKLWFVDEAAKTATEIKAGLNLNAYRRSWLFKSRTQTYLYLVDGKDLYKYDGNNDNKFEKVDVTTSDGASINPIDVIEHKDRLCLISETDFYISKNLFPDIFDDATDSLDIIVGSGKGKNKAFGKIGRDVLFIMNTEAKFQLVGDTISAVAITFSIDMVEFNVNNIISERCAVEAEGAIYFLAQDYEVYRFNGVSSEKVSHYAKLQDIINPYVAYLKNAVMTYEDNYVKLSFTETGNHRNMLEYWYDTVEQKDNFVRGRNVASYMQTDPAVELPFKMIGKSSEYTICYADRGQYFDGDAIRSRLWTKDITLKKNFNSRITNFYIDMETTGPFDFNIFYILDGRIDPVKSFAQRAEGEYNLTSFPNIHVSTQNQYTDRAKPKIKFAKGETISFYIDDNLINTNIILKGITVEYEPRERKKLRKVGG